MQEELIKINSLILLVSCCNQSCLVLWRGIKNDLHFINRFAWKCCLPFRQLHQIPSVIFLERFHLWQHGFIPFLVVLFVHCFLSWGTCRTCWSVRAEPCWNCNCIVPIPAISHAWFSPRWTTPCRPLVWSENHLRWGGHEKKHLNWESKNACHHSSSSMEP